MLGCHDTYLCLRTYVCVSGHIDLISADSAEFHCPQCACYPVGVCLHLQSIAVHVYAHMLVHVHHPNALATCMSLLVNEISHF